MAKVDARWRGVMTPWTDAIDGCLTPPRRPGDPPPEPIGDPEEEPMGEPEEDPEEEPEWDPDEDAY
jgi:hypothetical protein